MAMFNEYMNWGLIALYSLDRAPEEDHEILLDRLDRTMGAEGRGFLRFPEFSSFLVESYTTRSEGETIADLYPSIIRWFADREASAG